jgi:hypothetical protein
LVFSQVGFPKPQESPHTLRTAASLSTRNSIHVDGQRTAALYSDKYDKCEPEGRELEIVDEQGRVRASIKVHPANSTFKMPDGKTGYPETVMFRLIDSDGRPEVKLGASEQGGGLGLVGGFDSTHVILQAEGTDSSLKLTNKDGRQQISKP